MAPGEEQIGLGGLPSVAGPGVGEFDDGTGGEEIGGSGVTYATQSIELGFGLSL